MDKLPNQQAYGKKITAIIYCREKQVNGKQFLKYTYVDNSYNGLDRFIKFAAKFPGAQHINFYSRDYSFIEQLKFE